MEKYVSVLKNVVIILLVTLSVNLFLRVQKADKSKLKELQRLRKRSEEVVAKKEHEIQSLRSSIKEDEFRISKSVEAINQTELKKQQVETLYVNKIQEINSFDANQLKNYFHEELK